MRRGARGADAGAGVWRRRRGRARAGVWWGEEGMAVAVRNIAYSPRHPLAETIETELSTICADINTIIENVLIPGSTNDEAKVFYFKMAGDYYRYQAEYTMDTVREQNKADAEKAYADATTFALNLQATHPIRLGLALNFSVFYYEIKEESKAACDLANKAFEDAISELDSLNEESYKVRVLGSEGWGEGGVTA